MYNIVAIVMFLLPAKTACDAEFKDALWDHRERKQKTGGLDGHVTEGRCGDWVSDSKDTERYILELSEGVSEAENVSHCFLLCVFLFNFIQRSGLASVEFNWKDTRLAV